MELEEKRREFVQQLLRAQEEERRQSAYEIHDGPAQQLTGAAMFFETFRDERTTRESDVAERRLELGVKYLNDALVETRRIMSHLRPALLDDLGLVPALRSSLSELTSNANVDFELQISGEETRLDDSAEIVLFRVALEAVGNAVKHSSGTSVWLDIGFFPDHTELTVRDDGQGFDPAAVARIREEGRHLGLVGMRERTELLGGTFEIDSGAGRGTRLSVTIPRSEEKPADGLEHSHG